MGTTPNATFGMRPEAEMTMRAFDPEDDKWMWRAIEIARSKGSDPASSPLGSVIVLNGREIAAQRNQTQELPDATAHA